MTLFLISILTLMLTAAFAKVQSDRRVAESSGANVTALAIAKAGLQQYMGTRPFNSPGSVATPWRPPGGDSIRITLAGGYADVIARVVRKPADTLANWLYVIRSVGHVIEPTQGADPQAVRTIAQFAQWQTGRIDVTAAYLAANSINTVNGNGSYVVTVSGEDMNGSAPTVAADSAPFGSAGLPNTSNNGASTDWDTRPVVGPPNPNRINGSPLLVAQKTNIDWYAILSGAFTPDYTTIQTSGADQWNYTSQMVTGNATLNGTGSGLLIVTGDLSWGTNSAWYGIILVGGRIVFNDNNAVYGALFSGLNQALGTSVVRTDLGSHTVSIMYNSAYVGLALARLTGFAPIPNGWVDNWAMY
jgi:hypothetical protein